MSSSACDGSDSKSSPYSQYHLKNRKCATKLPAPFPCPNLPKEQAQLLLRPPAAADPPPRPFFLHACAPIRGTSRNTVLTVQNHSSLSWSLCRSPVVIFAFVDRCPYPWLIFLVEPATSNTGPKTRENPRSSEISQPNRDARHSGLFGSPSGRSM